MIDVAAMIRSAGSLLISGPKFVESSAISGEIETTEMLRDSRNRLTKFAEVVATSTRDRLISIAISQIEISEIIKAWCSSAFSIAPFALSVSFAGSRASHIIAQVSKRITALRPIECLAGW